MSLSEESKDSVHTSQHNPNHLSSSRSVVVATATISKRTPPNKGLQLKPDPLGSQPRDLHGYRVIIKLAL